MKPSVFSLALLMATFYLHARANSQTIDKPLYMGKASTGESVYFYGGRAQCGDLPRTDSCWSNPMIKYTLGGEEFNTVLNCRNKVFSEAYSVTTGKIYKNITPSSTATRKMVAMACRSATRSQP